MIWVIPIEVTARAPGKAILFGEHAVVFGKPAIAVAVKRHTHITITPRTDQKIYVEAAGLGVTGYLDLEEEAINTPTTKFETGLLKYVLKALKTIQEKTKNRISSLYVAVKIDMPVGSGLGSSAAVTVATLAAAARYYGLELTLEEVAKLSHQVELEVQGAASPIDTILSTYGGAIYLSPDAESVVKLPIDMDLPLVIGHTRRESNTGKLVLGVRRRRDKYPQIIDPVLESIAEVTEEARSVLQEGDKERLGELMNINQGLLDALGVNTDGLSLMVYLARENGALGSKITGAGGGGSIIAYCPGKMDEVLTALQQVQEAFPAELSPDGVKIEVKE